MASITATVKPRARALPSNQPWLHLNSTTHGLNSKTSPRARSPAINHSSSILRRHRVQSAPLLRISTVNLQTIYPSPCPISPYRRRRLSDRVLRRSPRPAPPSHRFVVPAPPLCAQPQRRSLACPAPASPSPSVHPCNLVLCL